MTYKPENRHRRYLANREREIENAMRWNAEHPERHRDINREFDSRRRQADPDGVSERFRVLKLAAKHGMRPDGWAALWTAQGGRCYLCGDQLGERVHVDHDHRCCPRDTSCPFCRRGLACARCNQLIGMADDDPDRLRRIAGNLETALKVADERLAGKPVQATLEEAEG
jgi:hypothetical protein